LAVYDGHLLRNNGRLKIFGKILLYLIMTLSKLLGIFLLGSILFGSCSKTELPDGISSDTTQISKVPKGFKFPARYIAQIDFYGTQVMEKGLIRRIGLEEQKKYFPYMPFENGFWYLTQGGMDLSPKEDTNFFTFFEPIELIDHQYFKFSNIKINYKISNDSLFLLERIPYLFTYGHLSGFYEYSNFIKCDDLYFTLPRTQHALSPKEVEEYVMLYSDYFMRYFIQGKPKSIAVASYKTSYHLQK
jgi:hypothetical protein